MNHDFYSYEAYLERYKTFYDEEGDNRPPILEREQFFRLLQLLKESYETYKEMAQLGHMEQAANYYSSVINDLENKLAIADASDNFDVKLTHF
ncbi:hypothetical protein [Thermoactinomyces mirandus]|uniref:Uncharacterized protein n=1 Tax=Thermoactinomyces mirandus TaxID=2756294 RepID=A0A7W1XP63_9BACL|nr:hypothetical protein [Thermoactinomyces mirandus]MBA4600732.1 hypothetical protein [Thermoactinomyces mirandus]